MAQVTYEKLDNYAILTMNRPERLNAFGQQMKDERDAALADFIADDRMRVAIVTGAGRAFCVGGDIKDMASEGRSAHAPSEGHGTSIDTGFLSQYSKCPKPIIAAINGLCMGGGFALALDADIRICSSNAEFSMPEPRLGRIADYGVMHLPHLIGMAAANYVLFTAERFGAEQAREWGIVSEVTSSDQLMPRAVKIAEAIGLNAPLSMQGTKAAIQLWRQHGMATTYRFHDWMGKVALETEDAREGPRAFAEKRTPIWKGR